MPHKKKHGKRIIHRNSRDEWYLLDKFSQADLNTWRIIAANLEAYQVGLYYHLEGLRQLYNEEICSELRSVGGISQELHDWCRIVDYQYSMHPLSAKGSLVKSGRFNIGTDLDRNSQPIFPALYCAESYETAYLEKFGAPEKDIKSDFSGHELALRKPSSFASVQLKGIVNNIFDLKKESNLKSFMKIIEKFDLSRELKALAKKVGIPSPYLATNTHLLMITLLDQHWRNLPIQFGLPSNPQIFGNLLRNAGFEGVVYPTSKGNENCLAIFPENLGGSESFVELADFAPSEVTNTKLDSVTWRNFV